MFLFEHRAAPQPPSATATRIPDLDDDVAFIDRQVTDEEAHGFIRFAMGVDPSRLENAPLRRHQGLGDCTPDVLLLKGSGPRPHSPHRPGFDLGISWDTERAAPREALDQQLTGDQQATGVHTPSQPGVALPDTQLVAETRADAFVAAAADIGPPVHDLFSEDCKRADHDDTSAPELDAGPGALFIASLQLPLART
jgi:hypothetical protein